MTTEQKHTPGPWNIRNGKFAKLEQPMIESDGAAICTLPALSNAGGSVNVRAEEIASNARLIAAAPDLLAALEHAEEYLSSPPFIALHGSWASRLARAAIAKATQPQP